MSRAITVLVLFIGFIFFEVATFSFLDGVFVLFTLISMIFGYTATKKAISYLKIDLILYKIISLTVFLIPTVLLKATGKIVDTLMVNYSKEK